MAEESNCLNMRIESFVDSSTRLIASQRAGSVDLRSARIERAWLASFSDFDGPLRGIAAIQSPIKREPIGSTRSEPIRGIRPEPVLEIR